MNIHLRSAATVFSALFLAFLVLTPTAEAQMYPYAGTYNAPPNFFFPYGTGIGAPREVMTVHAWGPTQAPEYHTMNSASPWQTIYPGQTFPTYPQQQYIAQHYVQPQYYQPQVPQYVPVPQYIAPQYMPVNYGYSQPQYGGGYGQPDGFYDIWGRPTCNWGPDYMGNDCVSDPHQYLYDPWAHAWY